MNDARYRIILYVIIVVIAGTISIQVYWNYKNYKVNKQQLINDVQLSLDNAIETYYAQIAKKETYNFSFGSKNHNDSLHGSVIDSIRHNVKMLGTKETKIDSFDIQLDDNFALIQIAEGDSIYKEIQRLHGDSIFLDTRNSPILGSQPPRLRTMFKEMPNDSIFYSSFRSLTSKVIISLSNDSLSVAELDSIFKNQLFQKNIDIEYGLKHEILEGKPIYVNQHLEAKSPLSVKSTSPYLHFEGSLTAFFSNSTKVILKRILTGILLSTLLVLVVISCLFYLLKIIKQQKQIAEVKNDFISNITHEFKTPIATIGVALESIKNFNVINDTEKTKSYIDMSNTQLTKLNVMVEKLLETASLDSENLQLKKERSNVTDLIQILVNKHNIELTEKSLSFNTSKTDIYANIDAFHFENAINNIIDNAVKYGGDTIKVDINQNTIGFTVSISDDGTGLNKVNKDKIFEKFYRIPKGNTHDVKGFGIGLYYTKKIVEKHNGAIHLNLDNQWTTFKISIPNE